MQLAKKHTIAPRTIFFFVLSAVVFFLLLSAVINLGGKYITLKEKLQDLETQKQNLQTKKEELSTENDYLATPEGQEHILREKYQLVKPGEGLIVITEPTVAIGGDSAPKKGLGKLWDTILKGLGIRH